MILFLPSEKQNKVLTEIHVSCDGSVTKNPGGIGCSAAVIKWDGGQILARDVFIGKKTTSNIAEFRAVVLAMRVMNRYKHKFGKKYKQLRIVIKSDSQLIINQINGSYACNLDHLQVYLKLINRMKMKFKDLHFKWVPREDNIEADALSKSFWKELSN